MPDFEKGDLVKLKSGGPKMTVEGLVFMDKYECQWFSGSKLQSGTFDPDTLVLVVEEDDEEE